MSPFISYIPAATLGCPSRVFAKNSCMKLSVMFIVSLALVTSAPATALAMSSWARRVVDGVLAHATRSTLKADELRDHASIIEQVDAARVHQR
jgi:hypothetical protein